MSSNSESPSSSSSGYKTFTRGALITLVGVLLSGILSYFTRRVLVINLSSEEYGFFYSAFSFVCLGLALVDLGLGKSGTVLMAKYAAQGKAGRVNLFFSIIFLLKLLIGILLCLLVWLLASDLVNDYFSFTGGLMVMLCLAIFIPLQAVSGFISSSLEAIQAFGARTVFQIVYYGTVLGLVFLFAERLRALAPAVAYCSAAILVLFLGLFYLRVRYNVHFVWSIKGWFKVWPEVWVYARWLTLSVIALTTMNYVDTLMLTWISGLNSVAGYQVALPLAQIARSLVFLPIVFMPIATELWQQRQLDQIKEICNFVTLLMVFCSGAGFLILLPLAGDLISLLFDNRYQWAASTLVVLGCGMPLLVVAQFYLNTLNSMDKPRVAARAALSGLIANIMLNLLLIPVFGTVGAALATILSFFVIIVFTYRDLRRELILCLCWRSILILLVVAIVPAVGFELVGKTHSWLRVFVILVLYCSLSFFVLRPHFHALRKSQ